jgi:hypothetical protein
MSPGRAIALAVALATLIAAALASGAGPVEAQPAQAGIPRPERHPLFGYNEIWSSEDSKPRIAARGGADVARVVLSWIDVERREGVLRWHRYDQLHQRFAAEGMRPLWVLADAPCWARDVSAERCREQGPIAHPPAPEHYDEFALFAARVAERYPDAVAIEAWNEPNLWMFWKPRPEPEQAALLTAWANLGVDSVDPSMPLLLGGLAPSLVPVPGEQVTYKSFLRTAYAAVGTGHWDGVAIHPFPSFQRSTHYLREIVAHLRRVRKALRAGGAAGTPIWVTEVGLSTAGLRPYSSREQAKGLVRVYRTLANMRDVPAVVVHRLFDQHQTTRTAESGWGVFRHDGERKPAFCALARERGRACGRRR